MSRTFRVLLASFLVLLMADAARLAGSSGASAAEELPSKESGEKVTQEVCAGCHGVDFFGGKRMTREMWRLTIEDMIGRGAVGTDEQFEQVISYLSAYRGTVVKVNEANAQLLGQVLDVPIEQAQAIVDFRAENGRFANLESLLAVPGIDRARVYEQKLNLSFD